MSTFGTFWPPANLISPPLLLQGVAGSMFSTQPTTVLLVGVVHTVCERDRIFEIALLQRVAWSEQ